MTAPAVSPSFVRTDRSLGELRERFPSPHRSAAVRRADSRRIMGCLVLTAAEYEIMTGVARKVGAAISNLAVEIEGAAAWRDLAAEVGYPRSLAALLPSGGGLTNPAAIMRLDIVISRGQPHVIEVNVGSALGGPRDVESWNALLTGDGLRPAGWPNRSRLATVAGELRRLGVWQAPLLLPLWPWSHIPKPAAYFESTMQEARLLGLDLRLVELENLPRELGHRPSVLKLFDTSEALEHHVDLVKVGYRDSSRAVWVADQRADLLSDKTLLAHESFQRHLSAEARGFVAPTWRLSRDGGGAHEIAASVVSDDRHEWLLKPGHGHGGEGVTIGASSAADHWSRLVARAIRKPTIAQRYLKPDSVEVYIASEQQPTPRRTSAIPVYGLFVMGGEPCGLFCRLLPTDGEPAVVNGGSGALVTSVMLAREPQPTAAFSAC